jgi:hypothetical protein
VVAQPVAHRIAQCYFDDCRNAHQRPGELQHLLMKRNGRARRARHCVKSAQALSGKQCCDG